MPSPPSGGHPGLPESDHVDGISMNYITTLHVSAMIAGMKILPFSLGKLGHPSPKAKACDKSLI
jgi:hypothetical protein